MNDVQNKLEQCSVSLKVSFMNIVQETPVLKTFLTFSRRKAAVVTSDRSTGYAVSILHLQLQEAANCLLPARRATVVALVREASQARHLAALQHRIQKREARILRQLGAGNGAIAEAAAIAELVEQRRAGLQRLRWLQEESARLGRGADAVEARIDELQRCRRLALMTVLPPRLSSLPPLVQKPQAFVPCRVAAPLPRAV
jgi:hypothetical protein